MKIALDPRVRWKEERAGAGEVEGEGGSSRGPGTLLTASAPAAVARGAAASSDLVPRASLLVGPNSIDNNLAAVLA